MYADRSSEDGQFYIRQFFEKRKYERGRRLEVNIRILFYGDN
jgi:hypothetical protein